MQQKIRADLLDRHINNCTIGFTRLIETGDDSGVESAGSGTLVTVGSLHGILTAAHVVERLLNYGKVGLSLVAKSPDHYQRLVMDMDRIGQPVVIKASNFGPLGPDLAFVPLVDNEVLGWLKAKSSFYSLSKRRDAVLSGERPPIPYSDNLVGTIHELTEEVPSGRPRVRLIKFRTIFCPVRPTAVRCFSKHDLIYLRPTTDHEPSFNLPLSFEGVSGGAFWKTYVTEKNGINEVTESRLMGVPFYQSIADNGKIEITCHWSYSIYKTLIDEVRSRWPKESS